MSTPAPPPAAAPRPDAGPRPDAAPHADAAGVEGVVLDPCRLAALADADLLDTEAESAFDRLTELAGRLLGVPVALVSLVDRDRQWFKSSVGLPEELAAARQTSLDHSFCKHVVADDAPLAIEDAREHPLTREYAGTIGAGVVAYAGCPLRTADGQTLGSFCVIDGSPRKWTAEDLEVLRQLAASCEAEIRLRIANRRLEARAEVAEAADRAKTAFLSHVSHELRTPLTGILGYAELLADARPGSPEWRSHVDTVRGGGRHLLDLINGLLDLAKIEAGRTEYLHAPCDVAALLDEALTLLRPTADAKGLELTAHWPAGRPGPLVTDGGKLRQILTNLLGNAVKFTEAGGVVVRGRV
ncbi:GAF domain-containing sensor histidine kinase, partial [Alienimonas sp. DA493]|uniref:sensor histidine kinase n=1 Tax=Alienimonas sp. DA493 TaxID=3373605 RepID=UPI003754CDB3